MSSTSPLVALARIISQGVQTLESAYSKKNLSFPSLDEPFKPSPLDDDPDVGNTTRLVIAAAFQIIATVRPPQETILDYAPAMYLSATLGVVDEANIADALKEAGPKGLHVNDISTKTGVDSDKLSRVLRYLASRHVFTEVSPDVYANNRISSVLAKTKPLEEVKKDKLTKYDGAPSAAYTGHMTDESFKAAAYLSSYIKDGPQGIVTPWNLATGKAGPVWRWYEEPENLWRFNRFTAAMKGSADHFASSIYTESLDWKSLPPNSVVVDVGGSVGKVTYELYKVFPHLKYVVQDLPPVVKDAENFWAEVAPKAVKAGRVSLQAQDFFQPQAIKGPAAFVLRFIIHDWLDGPNIKILKHLRAAATPATRLVIFDALMPHVCAVPGGPPPPPSPLLGNLGAGMGAFLTMLDLQMLTVTGGKERTLKEFVSLGAAAGWKLETVKPGMPSAFVFVPV
ncbi:S-adenosyl-L-methionine-dependent methyltransferase [Lactarius akahatsu]|uniref:S-adenosyl-L-methionine-dependent methyltransferase n=1 Tax=Lactarius akahatsu TaxID=416441 RepID=A0AAD4L5J4_9AGAM|nr:S-adenosyl-L-methionine-dependent methyltransferase [Lactarius akahatsu]KAH8984009.1 S-adenosyl-L-methionine-dependent methyltransferase [Lactarius akahatsu]